jgi:8-oxo-dGTP pyrophosphatase MutT (NUDIX family)
MSKKSEKSMRITHQRIVSGVLISADGKILMGQNVPLPGAIYSDTWHIPGGVRDEGETDRETLARETLEETGIDISDNKGTELAIDGDKGEAVRGLKSGEKILCKMRFYTYKVLLPKKASEYPTSQTAELQNLTWFKPEELKNLPHNPVTIRLLKKMGYWE